MTKFRKYIFNKCITCSRLFYIYNRKACSSIICRLNSTFPAHRGFSKGPQKSHKKHNECLIIPSPFNERQMQYRPSLGNTMKTRQAFYASLFLCSKNSAGFGIRLYLCAD